MSFLRPMSSRPGYMSPVPEDLWAFGSFLITNNKFGTTSCVPTMASIAAGVYCRWRLLPLLASTAAAASKASIAAVQLLLQHLVDAMGQVLVAQFLEPSKGNPLKGIIHSLLLLA
jgi:hypothetical protein